MELVDVVAIVIIAAIVGCAGWYIYRAKKRGKKCIGCPDSGACGGARNKCNACWETKTKNN